MENQPNQPPEAPQNLNRKLCSKHNCLPLATIPISVTHAINHSRWVVIDTSTNPEFISVVTFLVILAKICFDMLQTWTNTDANITKAGIQGRLGSFGITGNLALQPMYTLSGGQKSGVAFAKDLDAVEALIQGLVLFQGGMLMVSHDEHLISGSVEQLWAVTDGKAC